MGFRVLGWDLSCSSETHVGEGFRVGCRVGKICIQSAGIGVGKIRNY